MWEEKESPVPTVLLTSHFGMTFHKMSSRLCTCHGGGSHKALHSLAQPMDLKEDLPGRFSRLLLVPFTKGDSLPLFVCQSCRAKAESIESKLDKFRELTTDSFSKFHVQGSKRPNRLPKLSRKPQEKSFQSYKK